MSNAIIWAGAIIFETMEDLEGFKVVSHNPGELAEKFYSFMNLSPATAKSHMFSEEIIHNR
ncbi:MAG: hypothetical protein FWD97_06070 [Defluviitaleaceae bacterium]|nr:hypothetical protein [Defluviitaleaceae bacterium]